MSKDLEVFETPMTQMTVTNPCLITIQNMRLGVKFSGQFNRNGNIWGI